MADGAMTATFLAVIGGASLLAVTARGCTRATKLPSLEGWALADRSLGPVWTWLLLGGTIFTAYTFAAIPGLGVRQRRARLLRAPVHGHRLPDGLRAADPAVDGRPAGTATSRRPTSSAAATARRRWPWWSRSPGSSRRCPTSRCSCSASARCWRPGACYPRGAAGDLAMVVLFAGLAVATYRHGLRTPTVISALKGVAIFSSLIAAVTLVLDRLGGPGAMFETRPTAARTRHGRRLVDPRPRASRRLRHARPGLGAGAVDVPARAHRRFAAAAAGHAAQGRGGAARLDGGARPLRLARHRRSRGGRPRPARRRRGRRTAAGRPADAGCAGRAGVRRDHRGRAGAGGGDVDRGGHRFVRNVYVEYFHPTATPKRQVRIAKAGVAHGEGGRGRRSCSGCATRTPSTSSSSAGSGSCRSSRPWRSGCSPRWLHRRALLAGWARGHGGRHLHGGA